MPDQITGSGVNPQGNKWDTRTDSDGNPGYHYSNTDKSYYYANPNGSTYYSREDGFSQYTSPEGEKTNSFNPPSSKSSK